MEDEYLKIPINKVIDRIRGEERQNIKNWLLEKVGKPTADLMDMYVPKESEIFKLFSR